jgi:hypothetical protein
MNNLAWPEGRICCTLHSCAYCALRVLSENVQKVTALCMPTVDVHGEKAHREVAFLCVDEVQARHGPRWFAA